MKNGRFLVHVALGVVGIFFLSAASFASEEQAVIIGLQRGDGASAEGIVQALGAQLTAQGGRLKHSFTLIDAVAARVSEKALQELQQNPNVRYIVPDGAVATPEHWADGGFTQPGASELRSAATPVELYSWGVKRVKAPVVHRAQSSAASATIFGLLALGILGLFGFGVGTQRSRKIFGMLWIAGMLPLGVGGCSLVVVLPHPGILGEGVQVALLDTGIDLRHPDLQANYWGGVDLVNSDDDPQDDNGHGTGVAGILAAAQNGLGLIGVAPKVKVWSVKMLDRDEQGSISDLIEGIEWAIERGAQIISMSLGTPDDNPALREAVEAAQVAGKLLIAASGNKGPRVLYPAAYPQVMAVAATDKSDQRAWFSNMGPEVEIAAPGTDLLSTGLEGKYQIVNGTSFSVPHVAGVAALLFSLGISDASEVRRRLDETAEDLGLAVTAQGYGLVDAERAVLWSSP